MLACTLLVPNVQPLAGDAACRVCVAEMAGWVMVSGETSKPKRRLDSALNFVSGGDAIG